MTAQERRTPRHVVGYHRGCGEASARSLPVPLREVVNGGFCGQRLAKNSRASGNWAGQSAARNRCKGDQPICSPLGEASSLG